MFKKSCPYCTAYHILNRVYSRLVLTSCLSMINNINTETKQSNESVYSKSVYSMLKKSCPYRTADYILNRIYYRFVLSICLSMTNNINTGKTKQCSVYSMFTKSCPYWATDYISNGIYSRLELPICLSMRNNINTGKTKL